MRTEKMGEEFREWYMKKYRKFCELKDDWKLTLPVIYSDNPGETEKEHYEEWWRYLTKLLWPRRSKRIYKDRGTYKQTWLDHTLWWLWLGYAPIFKSNKEKDETNWNTVAR